MTKKLKITLGSILGLAGAVAITVGVGAGICSAQHSNVVSTSLKTDNYKDSTNVAKISTTPVLTTAASGKQEVTSYTLKLDTSGMKNGDVWFVNHEGEEVQELQVKPGDYVQVRAQADEGYTLGKLSVYGNDPSITLGTEQNGAQYTFQIPSDLGEATVNGMPNPFQPDGTTIHVKATFVKDVLSGWSYNFNLKSYVLSVMSDDFVLADSDNDLNLTQFAYKNDIGTDHAHPTNFIILLNGHTVKVNHFTIPAWCNLILLNNLNNTQTNSKNGTLENEKDAEQGFIVGGVLTTYQHVTNNASVHGQRAR